MAQKGRGTMRRNLLRVVCMTALLLMGSQQAANAQALLIILNPVR
jgi:hypothetical protein